LKNRNGPNITKEKPIIKEGEYMNNLAKMSIDELEELLSKVTDPTSASPAEAVLQSKSIRFLSSEIAVFKEALCLESTKIQNSNSNLAKAHRFHSWAIIILTSLLFLATLAQAYIIFWTSKPERTIENIQALNKWSGTIKNQKLSK